MSPHSSRCRLSVQILEGGDGTAQRASDVMGQDGPECRLCELLSCSNRRYVHDSRNGRRSKRNTVFDSRNTSATRQAPTTPYEHYCLRYFPLGGHFLHPNRIVFRDKKSQTECGRWTKQ